MQLSSSLTDVVHNSLCAIQLLTSNPIAAQYFREDNLAINKLRKLNACLLDGISEISKDILNNIYNMVPYHSMTHEYYGQAPANRLHNYTNNSFYVESEIVRSKNQFPHGLFIKNKQ